MVTIISLDIGGLSISWSKNCRDDDHGFLFQPNDLQRLQSEQRNHDVEEEEPRREELERGFRRSLAATVPWLELLGHTLKSAETNTKSVATCLEEAKSYREGGDDAPVDLIEFDEFLRFVSAVSILQLDDTSVVGEPDEDKRIMGRFSEGLKARPLSLTTITQTIGQSVVILEH